MILVADASPLIFLGKAGQLELLPALFPGELLVPASVRDEVMAPPLPPAEELVLTRFLERCSIVTVEVLSHFGAGLSRADGEVLTLAVARRADRLLADERLLRRAAQTEGLTAIGTLGVLLAALRAGRLTPEETRGTVDELIREHRFRIGIEVYQAVLERISSLSSTAER